MQRPLRKLRFGPVNWSSKEILGLAKFRGGAWRPRFGRSHTRGVVEFGASRLSTDRRVAAKPLELERTHSTAADCSFEESRPPPPTSATSSRFERASDPRL